MSLTKTGGEAGGAGGGCSAFSSASSSSAASSSASWEYPPQPAHYICKWCEKPGHWTKDCITIGDVALDQETMHDDGKRKLPNH